MSARKRILATGGGSLLKMQQPDSTVISDLSYKDKSSSCETANAPTSSSFVRSRVWRSSVITVDDDSDHSDSVITGKPLGRKDPEKTYVENESICDSPSTLSNLSKKSSKALDSSSDCFFSPKKTETCVPSNFEAAATDHVEPDDFYVDDFDIDDFNESDIPDYFDTPGGSSVGQNPSAVKEGGPSKSSWEKKAATPKRAPKPSKICSPGRSA